MFAAIILGGRRERWSKEENLKKASAERLPWVEAAGARIPAVGCGTWELRGETCAAIVSPALTIGYRHIDTAQGYDNERVVGEGIHRAAIRREELFVTTGQTAVRLRRSLADFSRGEPSSSRARLHRPSPPPLAKSGRLDAGDDDCSLRREAARPHAKHRRFKLHDVTSRGSNHGVARADRGEPDRIPPRSRSDETDPRHPATRNRGYSLLPHRAWPCRGRPGSSVDWQGTR